MQLVQGCPLNRAMAPGMLEDMYPGICDADADAYINGQSNLHVDITRTYAEFLFQVLGAARME